MPSLGFGGTYAVLSGLDETPEGEGTATTNLDGFARDAGGHFASEKLGGGSFHGRPCARSLPQGRATNRQTPSLNSPRRVVNRELDGSKIGNCAAGHLALLLLKEGAILNALQRHGRLGVRSL